MTSEFDLNGSYFYCNKCVLAEEARRIAGYNHAPKHLLQNS